MDSTKAMEHVHKSDNGKILLILIKMQRGTHIHISRKYKAILNRLSRAAGHLEAVNVWLKMRGIVVKY